MRFKKFKLDFIVIGAQKSGTSALDAYLRLHDNIVMSTEKEIHFFDNENYFLNKPDYNVLGKYFPQKIPKKLHGETTPIYIYWRPCIERIYDYSKKIKLIALLRNPADRAFSHWNMEVSRKTENRSFKDCILEEIDEISKGIKSQHRIKSYVH